MKELENNWMQDTMKERMNETKKYAYNQALTDIKEQLIKEINRNLSVDDDFKRGVQSAYFHAIEIILNMEKI